MTERTVRHVSRRALMRGAGVAGAAALASTPAMAQDGPYDGYLNNADNYDGTTIDLTGQDEVTIEVGAQGNGGAFAFGPPAVQVDPGTTVVWEWTGAGGQHNVVDEDGNFESELTGDAGFTFEQTFDEAGVRQYFCRPHRSLGMKGVVAVGDTAEGTVEGGGTGGDGGGGDGTDGGGGDGSDGGTGEDGGIQQPAGDSGVSLLEIALIAVGAVGVVVPYVLYYYRYDERPAVEYGGPSEEETEETARIEEAPLEEPKEELGHDEYDPMGTLSLILVYFLLLAVLWVFMYFVEFLGNGPTVIG